MKLGLFYNTAAGGPGKVISNLVLGLNKIGIDINHNDIGDVNGCLNQKRFDLPKNILMGPNLFVIPTDNIQLINKYDNFVVPSEWVYDKYKSFDIMKNKNIFIWSVGIDTDRFVPHKNIKKDCLIYFKNRSDSELSLLINDLDSNGISYHLLRYGGYTEEELISKVNEVKSVILLVGTESQGIAYMEMLSMNTPCYVINKNCFDYIAGYLFKAISVPYFDDLCGMIVDKFDINSFRIFINNLNSYSPREYILKNHTLEISAKKYIEILDYQKMEDLK